MTGRTAEEFEGSSVAVLSQKGGRTAAGTEEYRFRSASGSATPMPFLTPSRAMLTTMATSIAPSALDPENLPFPPGSSPFRVKGVFHKGNLDYLERVVPGGAAAVLARVASAPFRAFFEQPFVAASFYDVFPLAAISYPSADMCSQSLERFLTLRARYQAEQQATGVYRSLLALSSPSAVATKLPVLAAQLYDFGTTESREVGPRQVEVARGDLPALLMPWYVPGTEAYVVTALRLSGAKNPRASTSAYRHARIASGLSIGTVTHTFSWD